MLSKGSARKVTIYLNEDTQHHLGSLYESILTFLMHKGVAGAIATKALAGFGAHNILHTPKIGVPAEHLPIRVEFSETAEKIEALLPTPYDMVTDEPIEVQDSHVVKIAKKGWRVLEPGLPHTRKAGKAKLMRIFMGEADRWHDEPLHAAIVNQLRMMGIYGATVYRGILGYGAEGHPHSKSTFHVARDLPIRSSLSTAISDGEIVRLVHSIPPKEAAADAKLPAR